MRQLSRALGAWRRRRTTWAELDRLLYTPKGGVRTYALCPACTKGPAEVDSDAAAARSNHGAYGGHAAARCSPASSCGSRRICWLSSGPACEVKAFGGHDGVRRHLRLDDDDRSRSTRSRRASLARPRRPAGGATSPRPAAMLRVRSRVFASSLTSSSVKLTSSALMTVGLALVSTSSLTQRAVSTGHRRGAATAGRDRSSRPPSTSLYERRPRAALRKSLPSIVPCQPRASYLPRLVRWRPLARSVDARRAPASHGRSSEHRRDAVGRPFEGISRRPRFRSESVHFRQQPTRSAPFSNVFGTDTGRASRAYPKREPERSEFRDPPNVSLSLNAPAEAVRRRAAVNTNRPYENGILSSLVSAQPTGGGMECVHQNDGRDA